MSTTPSVAAAQAEADAARARLMTTIGEIQDRIAPSRLVEDTVDSVRSGSARLAQNATDLALDRPGMVAGAAAAGTLLLARKPIGRLFRRLFGRARETTADDFGLAQDVTKG